MFHSRISTVDPVIVRHSESVPLRNPGGFVVLSHHHAGLERGGTAAQVHTASHLTMINVRVAWFLPNPPSVCTSSPPVDWFSGGMVCVQPAVQLRSPRGQGDISHIPHLPVRPSRLLSPQPAFLSFILTFFFMSCGTTAVGLCRSWGRSQRISF